MYNRNQIIEVLNVAAQLIPQENEVVDYLEEIIYQLEEEWKDEFINDDIEMIERKPQTKQTLSDEKYQELYHDTKEIIEITEAQIEQIIETREPKGLFYCIVKDLYIGIDNYTGNAWVEEFPSKDLCFQWLRGEISEVVKCTGCGFDFGWETGNEERGNIYQCEKCGSYICATCILESSLYSKELSCTLDSIAGLEEILCLECKSAK